MTREQQAEFVSEIIDSVKADLLAKVGNTPEEWDGHQLRAWIAERFAQNVIGYFRAELKLKAAYDSTRKTLREYQNDVLVNNL
jgi:hypothetical protein